MKALNCIFLLMIFYTFSSCSNDENTPTPSTNEPIESALIELNSIRDIFPTWAKFKATISQNTNHTRLVGFAFSTNTNPIVNNSGTSIVSDYRTGNIQFEFNSLTLQPNTTYYIKAFIKVDDSNYIYSNEFTFKTTGYFGPAGGYVAYDKGSVSDGWRFMEIHPTTLNYNTSGVGGKWGNTGTFISGTYPDFGKGLENTIAIVNGVSDNNCAAKLCYNLTLNGYSDWFLPSIQELYQLSTELRRGGISISYSAWSSSQIDSNSANCTSNTLNDPSTIIINSNTKGMSDNILPVRRF